MAELDKVMKGLETCRTRVHCKECPYAHDERAWDSYCEAVLHNDALELLDEQAVKIEHMSNVIRVKEEQISDLQGMAWG